jgi:hypothetical protein
MNAGAHRRRATNFTAPALTWHRAFWINVPSSQDFPNSTITELEDERKKARIALKDKIDEFIVEFHKFILTRANISDTPKSQIHPSVGGKIILFNRVIDLDNFKPIGNLTKAEEDVLYSDNRVVAMEFDWGGIAATARIEIHTEYFSITTFAELGSICNVMEKYENLAGYLDSTNNRLSDVDLVKVGPLREFFFHEFWDQRVDRIAADEVLGKILTHSTFRNLFADFRGMIISNRTCKLKEKPVFGYSEQPSWGEHIDFKLLPLFTEIKRYECTASYMLDGRALYMTTLGPQLPEAQDWELLPLQYILYVHESEYENHDQTVVSKWQLGRLIDRIHLLGTVRLASLKYLPELREASTSLSGLDGYVKEARNVQTGRIMTGYLRRAHQQLADITTKFSEGTNTDSGMLYRIERSRYYVAQFNANLEALRIRRLEGYQRYDEFVRHRLGPVFDFINRLGIRYERAVSTLSLLD